MQLTSKQLEEASRALQPNLPPEAVYSNLNPTRKCGCRMDFAPEHLKVSHKSAEGPDVVFVSPGCHLDDHTDYSMTKYGWGHMCSCSCHEKDPVLRVTSEAQEREETSANRRARREQEIKIRCASGWHDDPDNSGQCIYCGTVLDEEV